MKKATFFAAVIFAAVIFAAQSCAVGSGVGKVGEGCGTRIAR